jgi:hypothetical protein
MYARALLCACLTRASAHTDGLLTYDWCLVGVLPSLHQLAC